MKDFFDGLIGLSKTIIISAGIVVFAIILLIGITLGMIIAL